MIEAQKKLATSNQEKTELNLGNKNREIREKLKYLLVLNGYQKKVSEYLLCQTIVMLQNLYS